MTDQQLVDIVTTCMRNSEKRLATLAAQEAVESVVRHLQHVGVLDENGFSKPHQRLKVRVVNSACYPPLWVQ